MKFRNILIATIATITFLSSSAFAEKINTYLKGAYQDPASVQSALKGAGFEVLAQQQLDTAGDLTSIVFTCPTLKAKASQPNRGFAAVLRVLVNKKDNEISITNPRYFSKAFLQKAYDDAATSKVLGKINSAFAGLKPSKDSLDDGDLAGYHFMMGMPYYEDMATVGKGSHDELLAKVKAYEGGKNVIFELNLGAGSTLIGYKIGKDTAKFVQKIGVQNAQLLPYTILIEGDKARILAPKYYLAISYPQLKMSQFMTIATIPGAIEKDCEKPFK